jgi:glycosyltransferase involved in cell wall biosynthesis
MNILFVHQNFPGQYRYIAPELAKRGHHVVALTLNNCKDLPGVRVLRYTIPTNHKQQAHALIREFETKAIRADACAQAALLLKKAGFYPDVVCAHPGWGDALFLKDIWPNAKLLCFWEFYYHARGSDVNFDPEFQDVSFENAARLRIKNANNLLMLEAADWGVSPTNWQKKQFPEWARPQISVIHDGIDTAIAVPKPDARIKLVGSGIDLAAGEEVVTFVNRNLEPYRGYHIFMRALPELMRRRPNARVLIVGNEGVSYGSPAPLGKTWKQIFLEEVAHHIDMNRIHFLGNVPYQIFIGLLQVSAVHVYLTYPFVLSWSLLEAMSTGCLVIGSRTQPVEEIIRHGENGLLVDFFNADELSESISDALARQADYAYLREQARNDIVRNYDLRKVCLPKHVNLIEEL